MRKEIKKNKSLKTSTKLFDWSIRILVLLAILSITILSLYFYSQKRDRAEFERLNSILQQSNAKGNNPIPGAVPKKISETVSEPTASTLQETGEMLSESSQNILDGMQLLYDQNNDLAGWLCIPDTRINYPVMHTPQDPEYYLQRNFQKEHSLSGTPFVGECSSFHPRSDNIVLYGHNMKDGSMFKDLLLYLDKEFWQSHKEIEFYTIDQKQTYEIIAVIQTEVYSPNAFDYYSFVNAKNQEEFDTYISRIKKKSLYDTGISAEYGDFLLTLSTCAYHTANGRFAIIGRYQQ